MRREKKKEVKHKKTKKIILILVSLIIIAAISYVIYYNYQKMQQDKDLEELQEYMDTQIEEQSEESINKVKELQEINADVKGWIQIKDTNINYPVLQTTDNDYYLTHNYKKQKNKYGSIYLKNEVNIDDNNSNLILYGHNMKDDKMFNNLLKYEDQNYYEEHKEITLVTQKEERKYQIIAAFKSRVFYQDEKNVFRYYNYTNFQTKEMFDEYIDNINRIKLYDTGVTANYQEQLLTMITCEYSQENGRMVVVAKRVE